MVFCLVYRMEMKSQYSNLLADEIMEPEAQGGENGENEDQQVVSEIMARCFFPSLITTTSWEGFHFAGHEIKITEATDCYGAVVWPSALVLCHFLETNSKQYDLTDKNVIEIGAGTGLVSIVASLLGKFGTFDWLELRALKENNISGYHYLMKYIVHLFLSFQ
uniref:Uncharacterized protein n=1 Tax=Sarcophilus harrisii TaxID=9305 RepID=A0A7N4NQB6_SARHA